MATANQAKLYGAVGPIPNVYALADYIDGISAGPTGPTGPTGPAGPTGATGAAGTQTAVAFAALDLSALPTADPGGGKPWLKLGVLTVGA